MNNFDRAEQDYINSYKDLKDRMNEKYNKRIQAIYLELMQTPGDISEALVDGACENDMFGVQLLKYKDNYGETHDLIWTYIEKHLIDQATCIAEKE